MDVVYNCLAQGRYLVDIGIQDMQEHKYDYIYNALEFRIRDELHTEKGIVHLPRHWNIDGKEIQNGKNRAYAAPDRKACV